MAKNGTRTTYIIIGLLLTGSMTLTGLVTYAVTNTHETADVGEDLEAMKVGGCDPAIDTRITVAVIEAQLKDFKREITEDISDVRIQQTALSGQQTSLSEKFDKKTGELSDKQDKDTAAIIKAINDISIQ